MHPTVQISRRGAERIAAGHVWVYSTDVVSRGEACPGDTVDVADPRKRFLGTAHYSSTSQITLRLLSRDRVDATPDFYRRRISAAIARRQSLASSTQAYRLVHAEGDFLPGLIVDRYGDHLVIQTLTQATDRAKAGIVSCLEELAAPASIYERNDASVRRQEELPLLAGPLLGETPEVVCYRLNHLLFETDLRTAQKTGSFLDQRENYLAAARHAHGRALDCFTSAGGFALHIASRCDTVEAVDSSGKALDAARRNAGINQIANVQFREADAFDLLGGYAGAGRRFDTVIVDPPAYAKTRSALAGALRAYRNLNYHALQLLEPGGILVSCSCSYRVTESALLEAIAEAAIDCGRVLRVLDRRSQPGDHPVLLTVPETAYLKCLLFEVAAAA